MQKMQSGGAMGGGAPISFANSGGASPPMGVSGGAGSGVGGGMPPSTGAGAGVGGGGPPSFSFPGSSTAIQNWAAGATHGGNVAGLQSEGAFQGSEAGMPQNPTNMNPSTSVLSDLTSGVGPPLGTNGYGMATQGNVGNPASGQGAFDVGGLGGGTPPSGALGPGNASMGQDIAQLISPGNKSSMGRTIPNKRPASNSLDVRKIFPQTGLQPYNGALG